MGDTPNGMTQREIDLGLDAYAGDEHSNADLLKNLVGRTVLRFAEGTEEHAGTALMAVELSNGDELGVQVEMHAETSGMDVYPDVFETEDGWKCEKFVEGRRLERVEHPCPEMEIVDVVTRNIMDADEAEVIVILDPFGGGKFGINMHHDEQGRTEFFEL